MTKLPLQLTGLRLPAIAAPLFIISNPDLVLAQCKAGIVGSFPALNAREKDGEAVVLELWLKRITEELDRHNQANPDNPAAPFSVNQIVHRSNARLERDLEICAKWKVPIWITSLGARVEVNDAAHSCGGIALHDVINNRFAKKAIEKETPLTQMRASTPSGIAPPPSTQGGPSTSFIANVFFMNRAPATGANRRRQAPGSGKAPTFRVGRGATIGGNVWVTKSVGQGQNIVQRPAVRNPVYFGDGAGI